MDSRHCRRSDTAQQISRPAIDKARDLLTNIGGRPSDTYAESIVHQDGRFAIARTIGGKEQTEPEEILVAIPQSLGTIAAKATPNVVEADDGELVLRLEVYARLASVKQPDVLDLGQATILIDGRPSTSVVDRLRVVEESEPAPDQTLDLRINWGAFRNCAISECLGVGTCLPFVGSKIGCVYCLVGCLIDSIEEM